MYVSGMAAAESLKATGGGEADYQSVYAFNVNRIRRAEESYPCRKMYTPAIPAKW